jgi:hypothetical protein
MIIKNMPKAKMILNPNGEHVYIIKGQTVKIVRSENEQAKFPFLTYIGGEFFGSYQTEETAVYYSARKINK